MKLLKVDEKVKLWKVIIVETAEALKQCIKKLNISKMVSQNVVSDLYIGKNKVFTSLTFTLKS